MMTFVNEPSQEPHPGRFTLHPDPFIENNLDAVGSHSTRPD
jgi:hypothetical protein